MGQVFNYSWIRSVNGVRVFGIRKKQCLNSWQFAGQTFLVRNISKALFRF